MAAPRREAKQKKRAYLPADDLRKRKPSAMGQMERINPGLMRLHLPAGRRSEQSTPVTSYLAAGRFCIQWPVASDFQVRSD